MSSSKLDCAIQAWKRLWNHGRETNENHQENKTNNEKSNKNPKNNKKHPKPRNNKKTRKNSIKNINHRRTQTNSPHLAQYDLHQRNITTQDVEEFGDKMTLPKPDTTFRIVSQNLNNIPESAKTEKSRQIIDFIRKSEASIFAMQEIGLCHSKLPPENQWHERVYGRLQATSSIFGYNRNELHMTDRLQPGGVGLLATDDVGHRVIQRGTDNSDLGRWTWMLLEGKQHHKT